MASPITNGANLPGGTEGHFDLFQQLPRVKRFPSPPLALTDYSEEEMRHSLGPVKKKVALMPAAKAGYSNDTFELSVITSPYIAHTLVHLLASCTAMGTFTWAALRNCLSISIFTVCDTVFLYLL